MAKKITDIFDDVQLLVKKTSKRCNVCNPHKGVLLCIAEGCVYKELYGLLIECLCLKDKEEEELTNG